MRDGHVVQMHGYVCERGKNYAVAEATNPLRMLTTTVRVEGGTLPLLPVVSSAPLPKDSVAACVCMLADIVVSAPVREGEIVYPKVMGLNVDIIASRNLPARAL